VLDLLLAKFIALMGAFANMLTIILAMGISLLLHGCGGGGGGGGGATTTTTTTQLVVPSRSKPMTSTMAAAYLNKLYLGKFNQSDTTSPLGVTISMAAQTRNFNENLFCSQIHGAPFYIDGKQTKCFNGQADCRMSACLINNEWMISNRTKALTPFGKRAVGYVFNQSLVESKWTKCSYIWDGASANNYNRGCGAGAPGNSCEKDSGIAFYDICPDSKKTCTAQDSNVKRAVCQIPSLAAYGGETPVPTTHDGQTQCVFPGVAFDFHGQFDYKPGKDHTHDMVQYRLQYNFGKGSKIADVDVVNIELNNEIVIDEKLLIPDLWEDPVAAIPAFIYAKSNQVIAKEEVSTMRDQFCEYYRCSEHGGGKIPLVMVDDTSYNPNGPFSADSSGDSSMIV
jgi:hypothetical protein